ncbi:Bug family tripartite tricarboxylate transporter substrate binding protein [Pseudoroseomonas globiformis]|uniref:Bug family tripartite tricarboxylate transporter substrate binding protein n=1 Tax=Teichococcus globiformis TaxID=2307229 RepID=A0ABV7FW41_9PROT
MQRRTCVSLLAALPFAVTRRAQAQAPASPAWKPSRPVTFIVGFAPGGSTDTAARILAEAVGSVLGQSVVVENRAGAAGNIASEAVARSVPDGSTFVAGAIGTHAINQFLYPDMGFHVVRDFAPISLTAMNSAVLVAHPSLPSRSVAELVAQAKVKPGHLNSGTAGSGSTQHLASVLFEQQAGVEFTHVPYRGGAPAIADLIAGRVDIVFAPIVEALAHIQSGQLRALGVTRQDRSPILPEVPAIGEALPGYVFNTWQGLFAPAGTPPHIVAGMSAAVASALRQPRTRQRMEELGFQPMGSTAEEFATFQLAEVAKMEELVRLSGASAK